ncbi:hypothetical protein ACSTK6_13370 [Vibrio parahaemolyticus]
MKDYEYLKQRQRAERDNYPQNLSIRIHRALSGLHRAEQCEDNDAKFTFLWVSFNAAYAQEFEQRSSYGERERYQAFLEKLVSLDTESNLHNIVWDKYSGSIRTILNNEFILQAYWDFHAGRIAESEWKAALTKAKAASHNALAKSDTTTVLSVLFSRLYTLRNQIMHGGATFNSSANRQQLRDCTNILELLVPTIIEIMMNNPNDLWGEPVYPYVGK